MDLQKFYDKAQEILLEMAESIPLSNTDSLTKSNLEKYYTVDEEYDIFLSKVTIEKIFQRMVGSMQNRSMMPNVIKFWQENGSVNAKHKEILCDFKPSEILKKYADGDTLFKAFEDNGLVNQKHPKLFKQWSKSIVSGARFMCEFKNLADLKNAFDAFQQNGLMKDALPAVLSYKIDGFGFTLACDFLKEIGYGYPKPDTYIKAVAKKLIGQEEIKEYTAYKEILKIAELLAPQNQPKQQAKQKQFNDFVYKLDKILWLIGSGMFYKNNVKTSGRMQELIEWMEQNP